MRFAIPLVVAAGLLQSAPALKILVLEGEGAVNIIQQKTAVRPLVEVRDRNNVPVVGATVTFTIGGGGQGAAFAGGLQTLTVTTNAAGQAAATGMSALGPGAVQINVQAAFQGQLATAAISQTNFATAAAAAQAGATTGAGGGGGAAGAGGGAAGGGGGISGTTLGIVGGAVAGGAVAATQVVGKDSESDSGSGSNIEHFDSYSGAFSGTQSLSSVFTAAEGPGSSCTFTNAISGTLTIELSANGSGRAQMLGTTTGTSASSSCILDTATRGISLVPELSPVSGGPSAISFSVTQSAVANIEVWTYRFTGSLSGSTITGTFSIDVTPASGANPRRNGTMSMPVTLTRK